MCVSPLAMIDSTLCRFLLDGAIYILYIDFYIGCIPIDYPSEEPSMKATALYRTAGILLIACAAGNARGLLRFWHVAGSMNPVYLPVGDRPITYAQVVLGLGVFWSLSFLFGAYLAWHLGALVRTTPQAIGTLGWILFAYQISGVVIIWIASQVLRIFFWL